MITEEKMKCFVDEWIEVTVHHMSKDYYESLGYTAKNKKFIIHPWELKKYSSIKVKVKCPICKETRLIIFQNFWHCKSPLCVNCKGNLIKKNLSGQKFGRLTAIKDTGKRYKYNVIWLCKCDCGNYCEVRENCLISGDTKSCGCLHNEKCTQRMIYLHRIKNHFIKEDHTEEEIKNHLEKIKSRSKDFKWNALSKQLREDAKCCICGSINNLVVHHLNGYWEYPEQRYNKDNLVVVCKSCHQKFHNKYNSTKRDWEIYKNGHSLQRK